MCKELAKLELFLDIRLELKDIVLNELLNEEVDDLLNKYELTTIKKIITKK
jgi:hypothetical protein